MRRTKLATGVTLLLAVLYNVPLFFEREVKHPHGACSAFSVSIGKTQLGDSFVYFVWYRRVRPRQNRYRHEPTVQGSPKVSPLCART